MADVNKWGLPPHIKESELKPDATRPYHWYNEATDEVFCLSPEFPDGKTPEEKASSMIEDAKREAAQIIAAAQAQAAKIK